MASPGNLLEMKLMEVGLLLLHPPSAVEELLSLLDRAEILLSIVEQSPSSAMSASLFPAAIALVSKDILRHQDEDIKLGVASCISEITRITAPEVPYDNDLMKEAFRRIVEAFEKLDDMTSRSYPRRVSILNTVANVRSSVVMLDLECNALILEMFRHFLRTIGSNNSENVFFLMENIMTLVLEESDDIPFELLSCLLTSVKKDSKDILPSMCRLAEKVIANCGTKLKPYLVDTFNSTGVPLSDYCDIVASVCQGKSDTFDQDRLEACNKHLNFGKENNKDLNETLVGSKIKVWWPEDKLFYHGIVEAFEPVTKKHKVVYLDGDVEILLLKNERYELIDEGKDELTRSPTGPSKGQQGKRAKCSESIPRTAKKDASLKKLDKSRSGVKGSNSKNGSYIRKLRGKPSYPHVLGLSASSIKSNAKPANKILEINSRACNHSEEEEHRDRSMNEHSETGAKSTNVVQSKANINSDDETLATAMKLKNAGRDIPKSSWKHKRPRSYSSGKSNAKDGGASTKVKSGVQQSKFPAAEPSQDNLLAAVQVLRSA